MKELLSYIAVLFMVTGCQNEPPELIGIKTLTDKETFIL